MADKRGFSLVESMTVLAIFSTVALFAYPAVGNWKDKQLLKGEVRQLYGAFQTAKIEAAKVNGHVALQFYPNGYDVFLDNGAGAGKKGDWVRHPEEHQFISYRFRQGIQLVTNFRRNRTRFSGRFGNKAGTITINDSFGNSMKLIVNLVGRVRVEKG